jgi:hypothetical protein
VIIDGGYYQPGRLLRFRGPYSLDYGTFEFRNGATHDTIRNCIIEGPSVIQQGTITFSDFAPLDGNSFNAVIQNKISSYSDNPYSLQNYSIYSKSNANPLKYNTDLYIARNEISNFMYCGIALDHSKNAVIEANSFYETSIEGFTQNTTIIFITSGDGDRISDNYMGGSGPFCSGNQWVKAEGKICGINVYASSGSPASTNPITITRNTWSNFRFKDSFYGTIYGILIQSTKVDSLCGNCIGSLTDSASIELEKDLEFVGLGVSELYESIKEVSNNTIANIYAYATNGDQNIEAIKIMDMQAGNDTTRFCNNKIFNIYNNRPNTYRVCGIFDFETPGFKVFSGNSIYNLYGRAGEFKGISIEKNQIGCVFEKNQIFGITNLKPFGVVYGLHYQGKKCTILNNMVTLTNGLTTTEVTLSGIRLSQNTSGNQCIYTINGNSIRIGGHAANSTESSAITCYSDNNDTIQSYNNILVNKRSGNYGTHMVYRIGKYTGDYNCLYNTSNYFSAYNSTNYYSFSTWRTALNQENNSIQFNPSFVDALNGNLHLSIPGDSILLNKGIPVAGLTTDFDGEFRDPWHPEIGGDEVTLPNICGTVHYQNAAESPLGNCLVRLLDQNNLLADTTRTDSLGIFCFVEALPGQYHMEMVPSNPWGGVNAADALLILKHFCSNPLVSPYKEAGYINNDMIINAVDALFVLRRQAGIISSFPQSDWIFNTEPFNFASSSVNLMVRGICRGDVNASYQP